MPGAAVTIADLPAPAGLIPSRGCAPLHEDATDVRDDATTALSEVSDAWLVGRARELSAVGQNSDALGQRGTIREADGLLAEAQRRGEPRIVAQLLRHCAAMRLSTPGLAHGADPLLDELLTHSRRHGLLVLEADARALRGRRQLLASGEDNAISEVAWGLAMLEDELVPDTALGRRSWDRLLATALIDLGYVLTQLGVYEMAEVVMGRAHHRIRESGGPHEIAVHMMNRCRMLLGWGLRLERIGEDDEAGERFATASALAYAVEGPWQESLFPRLPDRTAWDQIPLLGAAHALAQPGPEHIERLQRLRSLDRAIHPREKIIVAIALSRCLMSADRRAEAVSVLAPSRAAGQDSRSHVTTDTSDPTLRISLAREYARLVEIDEPISDALGEYVLELETELWTMREARYSTLSSRLENARLNLRHDAITQQALQDPLTGLSNRRALDDRLDSLLGSAEAQPLSIALVDLDGFKEVNDRCSHAEGDDVLRVVATTLRDTLRVDDFVSRYGGDEFVVLLPVVALTDAESALQRTVEAIARLPKALSRGVTLSIGVVAMRAQESGAQVLARADAAMYQAKRGGGNQVATFAAAEEAQYPAGPSGPREQETWIPPQPH
ncbi:GGDEF domain-containing protein [Saccharopolyspora sp. HNM0986]|uniref:GGDEF domain-containing protein n=1 Tax=Saccharopolyspora galaxeae TaxID=2781241 RepID=UPI00190DC047|nr:GGDEF domain-containing protein [Saccharopolyspora sp. HNM0986]MBK0866611.1 GGDEF domain-containing protein [Saccharopolyspora sp. HNM0986]